MLENIYVSYQIQNKTDSTNIHKNIADFISLPRLKKSKLHDSFIEIYSGKKTFKWEQLQRAIEKTKKLNAVLIIAELSSYPQSDLFSKLLIQSEVNFYCCDLPFINNKNINIINQYLSHMRVSHGERIKNGLKNTSLRSGNPNASKIINKINKPKINISILFSLMLDIFVSEFKKSNLSQRQICKELNEIGFMAPEGGMWVLSQFQKIVKRININNLSYELGRDIKEYKDSNLDNNTIIEKINKVNPKLSLSSDKIDHIIARYNQLIEINNLLDLISSTINITNTIDSNTNINDLINELKNNDIKINNAVSIEKEKVY